jgi:hypothetical protein
MATDPTAQGISRTPKSQRFIAGVRRSGGSTFRSASNGENMEKRREIRNPMDFMGYETTDFMGIGIE